MPVRKPFSIGIPIYDGVDLITNEDIAKQVQLVTQYLPEPPFTVTIPGSDTCPLDEVPATKKAPTR